MLDDLQHSGDAKYIIVGITDSKAENPRQFQSYAFVSIDLGYHSDIYDEYEEVLHETNRSLKATVLGGGIVTIDKTSKKVKTYGTSGGYGSTSLELLKYVVGEAFADYKQDVTITRYIRG